MAWRTSFISSSSSKMFSAQGVSFQLIYPLLRPWAVNVEPGTTSTVVSESCNDCSICAWSTARPWADVVGTTSMSSTSAMGGGVDVRKPPTELWVLTSNLLLGRCRLRGRTLSIWGALIRRPWCLEVFITYVRWRLKLKFTKFMVRIRQVSSLVIEQTTFLCLKL